MRNLNNPQFLKLYLPLNSNTNDQSTNSTPTTPTAVTYTTGINGKSIGVFNGTTSLVSTSFKVPTTSSKVTLCGWVKINALGALAYIAGDERTYLSMLATNVVRFTRNNSAVAETTATLVAGQFYHIAGVSDGTNLNVYINGVLSAVATATITSESSFNFQVGARNSAAFWPGNIYEFRYYENMALTGDEISFLYNQSVPKINILSQPMNEIPVATDTSLVAAYLNSKTVGSGTDFSSNARTATAASVTWEKVGGNFNGTSSAFSYTSSNVVLDSAGTIAMTIKTPTANQTNKFYFGWVGASTNRFYIAQNGTILRVGRGNPETQVNLTSTVLANQTYRVVMTWGGGIVTGYLDGVPTGSSAFTGGGDSMISIGCLSAATNFAEGIISDVEIYSEQKSAGWVSDDFSKRVPDSTLVFSTMVGVRDISRYNSTITNTAGVVVGNGILCDGVSQFLRVATLPVTLSGDFTLMGWIRPITPAAANRFIELKPAAGAGINIYMNSSYTIVVDNSGGPTSAITSAGVAGQVRHFAVTRSGTTYSLYNNGVLAGTSAGTLVTNTRLDIGTGNGSFGNHCLYDVNVFSEAKSEAYINSYYNKTKANY